MMKNQKLSNRFIILYTLGKGAFSTVYKIRRIKDNSIYALKKVPIKNLKKKELQNALNEIRILASIKHPNIIGYREAFIDQTSEDLCIVMNYAGGGDLSAKIKECKKKKIRLPEKLIIKFFYQLSSALYELHMKKIIHRDLKTANILISEDLKNVQLGDMNVSKIVKNIFAYTQTGTPYYASPEVWRDEPYNVKTDIWSLGCVMYEMCMLRPPFSAVDMDDLFNKVQKCKMQAFDSFYSDELRSCISKLLTVNPHLRPNCEKILNFDIFNDLKILLGNSSSDNANQFDEDVFCNNELIKTIKAHKNFFDLGLKLPKSQYSDDETEENIVENDKKMKRKLEKKNNIKSSFKKKKKSVKGSIKEGMRAISSFINNSNIMNSYLKNNKRKNSRILKTLNSRNSKNSKASKEINKKKRKLSSVKKNANEIIKNLKNHSKLVGKYRLKSTKNNRQLIVNNRKIKRKSKSTKRKISRSRLILNNIEKIKKELAKNSETINKIIKRPRKLQSIKNISRKPYSIHKKIEIKKYNPSNMLDITKHSSLLLLRKSKSRDLKKKKFKISLKKKNDHILNMIKSRFSSKNINSGNYSKKLKINSISQIKNNKKFEDHKDKILQKNKKNIFINFSVNQNLCLNIPEKKKKIDIAEFVSFLKKGKEGRNVLLNSKRFITNPE